MFFLICEAQPAPDHPEYGRIAGAYASCFIVASSPDDAERITGDMLAESAWIVNRVEEGPRWVDRAELEGNQDSLDLFDQASADGAAIALHRWPEGATEED